MSRQLGFFEDDSVRDYPDLNKCPDCETFFESECCPLCGKPCPEEMRAGRRAPVKVKPRRYRSAGNGRVTFVPWYFSAWFIALMLFVQPIVGLILLWMSDNRRLWKVLVTVVVLLLTVGTFLLGGLMVLFEDAFYTDTLPEYAELSREEYAELCEEIDPEELYRNAADYVGDEVMLTLTVKAVWTNSLDYNSDYARYYYCYAEGTGGVRWYFLVRDYRQENVINLTAGDCITVMGEAAGNLELSNQSAGDVTAPGIHMLHLQLVEN